jgi:hypothetical protein
MFFSEEKNQKTFLSLLRHGRASGWKSLPWHIDKSNIEALEND